MPVRSHHYSTQLTWIGNTGSGTFDYRAYSRDHELTAPGKRLVIPGTSDKAFRGDPERHSPEDLLVYSLSACHMLWYLHLCAVNKVIVLEYTDEADGVMQEEDGGKGQFTSVTLRPNVVVAEPSMVEPARRLHATAHDYCFIARSVNFPVGCEPRIAVVTPA